jgi:spore maturation protein CgeB
VLEVDGRALDSRREPAATADRAVAGLVAESVIVLGFGTGYLAHACLRHGPRVAAIVEASAGLLGAAMRVRDLRKLLTQVRVVLLDDLGDPVQLATLRLAADSVLPHGPSLAVSPELGELARHWLAIPVARRPPRVVVAGPIYGGSLPMAAAVVSACRELDVDVQFFDGGSHAGSYRALGGLDISREQRTVLQGGLVGLLEDALVGLAVTCRADLVLAMSQAPLGETGLTRLREAGITTAFWFVENFRVLPYWQAVAPHYDWFYAIQSGRFLERLSEAGAQRPRYLPVGCDPVRDRKVTLTDQERDRYRADVSFAGSAYLNRRRALAALTDCGLRVWGPDWQQTPLAAAAAEGGRRFTLEEMAKISAASLINLNLHSAEHVSGLDPDPDYVNPRTFELAACGAFQLVDARHPLPDLFTAEEVASYTSVPQLRELIAHYLPRADIRDAMAARARRRALADHTYLRRVRQILRETLAPALAARAERGEKTRTLEDELAGMERAGDTLTADEALLRIVHDIDLTRPAL